VQPPAPQKSETIMKRQRMSDDLHLKLFAEIELLLSYCGRTIYPKYHKYHRDQHKSIKGVMMSIEALVGDIANMKIIAQKEGTLPPDPVEDIESFQEWEKLIYLNREFTTEIRTSNRLLKEVLKGLNAKSLTPVSIEIRQQITWTEERQIGSKNFAKDNGQDVTKGYMQPKKFQEGIEKKAKTAAAWGESTAYSSNPKIYSTRQDLHGLTKSQFGNNRHY
jgi:hypothetical protein